jgi:hypothetical protein
MSVQHTVRVNQSKLAALAVKTLRSIRKILKCKDGESIINRARNVMKGTK